MRRHLLGGIGLLCVTLAGWLLATHPDHQVLAGSSMRIGLVLLAIWLALPQLVRIKFELPFWLLAGALLGILLIAARPRNAVWVVPLAAALAMLQLMGWLLKPLPTKRRDSRRARRESRVEN